MVEKVEEILAAFETFISPVIFPIHPWTKPIVNALVEKHKYHNIVFVETIGYLDMLYFTKNAVKVVADSGGYTRYLVAYFEQCIKDAIDGTMNSGKFVVIYQSTYQS